MRPNFKQDNSDTWVWKDESGVEIARIRNADVKRMVDEGYTNRKV